MEKGKCGDLVMDSTEAEKIIYKISAIYNDDECSITAINPNSDGLVKTNDAIHLSKLIKVNGLYE